MMVDGMFGKPNPKANAEDGADCVSALFRRSWSYRNAALVVSVQS